MTPKLGYDNRYAIPYVKERVLPSGLCYVDSKFFIAGPGADEYDGYVSIEPGESIWLTTPYYRFTIASIFNKQAESRINDMVNGFEAVKKEKEPTSEESVKIPSQVKQVVKAWKDENKDDPDLYSITTYPTPPTKYNNAANKLDIAKECGFFDLSLEDCLSMTSLFGDDKTYVSNAIKSDSGTAPMVIRHYPTKEGRKREKMVEANAMYKLGYMEYEEFIARVEEISNEVKRPYKHHAADDERVKVPSKKFEELTVKAFDYCIEFQHEFIEQVLNDVTKIEINEED